MVQDKLSTFYAQLNDTALNKSAIIVFKDLSNELVRFKYSLDSKLPYHIK
jgi:hypothetical protein